MHVACNLIVHTPTLNPLTACAHPFTHDSKAVIDGQCMVFRTISGYAKGNGEVMLALSDFFRRPAWHAFLLPAASVFGEKEIDVGQWRRAPVLAIGDQVVDEQGRLFEIMLSTDHNLMLRQITYIH